MTSSSRSNQLPVPKSSQDHQTKEWASGTRGGGKMPADFAWRTNPKQQQEETGDAQGASEGSSEAPEAAAKK